MSGRFKEIKRRLLELAEFESDIGAVPGEAEQSAAGILKDLPGKQQELCII